MDMINVYLELANQLIEQQSFETAYYCLGVARTLATDEGSTRSAAIAVRVTQAMIALDDRMLAS